MKNLILVFFLFAAFTSFAQETRKKSDANGTQNDRAVMQDGNSATKNEKAVMQDGNAVKENKAVMQDGNSATSNERKAVMQDGNSKLAEHKCNDKCKSGKHEYLHGEKGHSCTDACKHRNSPK